VTGSTILDRLRAELRATPADSEAPPRLPDPEGRTLAGVLVLTYAASHGRGESTPTIVLTRRTDHLRRHSGQISLPGGRFDAADRTLLRTALRETHEELGVAPDLLELWGRLPEHHITASHYLITPYVAHAARRPDFAPDAGEVAEIIEVPLAHLLDPVNVEEELWHVRGAERLVSFFRYGEHKIWGATARVLGSLVSLIDPTFKPPIDRRLMPGGVVPESGR
jgi:8-oxo-dGTP pyrophosphatase MutT (NUDIX family)